MKTKLMMLGAMGMALAGFAGDATVLLNSYAVKEGGKIKVSCNAEALQSEAYCAYDGNQDTYFNPGDTANAKGVSWTGIAFDHDVLVTRIVFAGYRKKKFLSGYEYPYAYRMEGGAFQGANKSDFSDAVNLHVIEAYEGEKVTIALEEAKGPFRYLRYIGTYGGNVAEIEFYGLSDSGSVAPSTAPVVTSAWSKQGKAGFTFTADASIPQAYVFQRAMASFCEDGDYESFLTLIPALGETTTWNDTKATGYAKYRVRGVNALGASGWTYFTVEPEKLIVGADKPSFGGNTPGFYENEAVVEITYPVAGAKIYYTTDGSTPTMQSKEYTGAITLHDVCGGESPLSQIETNPSTIMYIRRTFSWDCAWKEPDGKQPKVNIIRARAFLPDGSASTNDIAGTWMIGPIPNAHKLRVVSIQTDKANYFGDPKGIMVPGDIYDEKGYGTDSIGYPNANYFQTGDDWERPVQIEMFGTDRKEMFSAVMGTRIRGNYTRALAKKSLACYARKEYGQKNIKKVLFDDDPDHKKFKRFVLRSGANDWWHLCLRDAVGQSMFRGEGITLNTQTQGYEPLVLYINGEYWGLYNLRHLYSRHHFEEWCGAAEDDIDFVKIGKGHTTRQYERQEGDFCAMWNLKQYMISCTKSDGVMDDAEYAEVERQVDMDDMIDYHIVHLFLGNNDWLASRNNIGLWRSRSGDDQKWHFVVYDCDNIQDLVKEDDYATDHIDESLSYTDEGDTGADARTAPGFFKRCFMNAGFRRRFANRYADLLNTALRTERTTNILEKAIARIDHEIERTTKRWTNMGSYSDWKEELGKIYTFYQKRPGYAWTHLKNHCSAGDLAQITVASGGEGEGTVRVNSITSGEHFELPFSGRYFTDIPITLTATPTKGSVFTGWTVGGTIVSTEPTYTVTPSDGLALTAVFSEVPKSDQEKYLRLWGFCASPKTGNDGPGEFIVVTNLNQAAALDIGAANLNICKDEDEYAKSKCNITFAEGSLIKAGSYLRMHLGEGYVQWTKITDGGLNIRFTAANGNVMYELKGLSQKDKGVKGKDKFLKAVAYDQSADDWVACDLSDAPDKPVVPGQAIELVAETQEAAEKEIRKYTVELSPEDVEAGLSRDCLKMEAVAFTNGAGQVRFKAQVAIDPKVVPPPSVGGKEGEIEPIVVKPGVGGTEVSVGIINATKGLWYGYEVCNALSEDFANDVPSFKRAAGKAITIKGTPRTTPASFFRVKVLPAKP